MKGEKGNNTNTFGFVTALPLTFVLSSAGRGGMYRSVAIIISFVFF